MGNIYLDELVELTQFIECENAFDGVAEKGMAIYVNK